MPVFLLIRHGENDFVKKRRMAGRLPDVHLNNKGRQQAEAVAQALVARLKDAPQKFLYSSPLERAVETAEPIAQALGLEMVQRPGLIETDIGEWQGQSLRALSRTKAWKAVVSSPALFGFPGGETFAASQQRMVNELQELRARHADPKSVIICVSHADPIKLAVAYFLGLPIDLFQRFVISPASLTTLHLSETNSSLFNLNIEVALP